LLTDGIRQIVGEFVHLDYMATLALCNGLEFVDDHEREIPVVLIPLGYVQKIKTTALRIRAAGSRRAAGPRLADAVGSS
jgi:hypothetical protein